MSSHNVRDDQLPQGAGSAPEVPLVAAASVIALRGEPFEVLLLKRSDKSTFVPGTWVFPGGIVEPVDRMVAPGDMPSARACAIRELLEETGIWAGAPLPDAANVRADLAHDSTAFADMWPFAWSGALVPTARWQTPVGVPKRFDTWFFLWRAMPGTEALVDDREGTEARWLAPRAAVEEHAAGRLPMVFPTIKNLEALLPFETVDQLLSARRGTEIRPILPKIVIEGGQKKVVLP